MAFFGFSSWGRKKSDDESLTLSDIIRGLQYCVNSSSEIAESHHINALRKFFDADNNPIKQRIKITDDATMDVPLVCLAEHSSLILDEIEVKLDVLLKNTALKTAKVAPSMAAQGNGSTTPHEIDRTSFTVDLVDAKVDENHTHLDMVLKFKSSNPPEAVSRIIDKLNNAVVTYRDNPQTED
jgi:hypothetical protein